MESSCNLECAVKLILQLHKPLTLQVADEFVYLLVVCLEVGI